jgi:hypothetical protein
LKLHRLTEQASSGRVTASNTFFRWRRSWKSLRASSDALTSFSDACPHGHGVGEKRGERLEHGIRRLLERYDPIVSVVQFAGDVDRLAGALKVWSLP